jgi:hypothetical protein
LLTAEQRTLSFLAKNENLTHFIWHNAKIHNAQRAATKQEQDSNGCKLNQGFFWKVDLFWLMFDKEEER